MTEITTPDNDQTENSREAATILRTGADTFEKKTRDYGSSWKSIGSILEIMAHGEPIVLDSTEKVIAFGLFTRRLDKFSREFFGTFFADEMNFEAVGDSAEDEMVYAAMAAENHADMAEKATPVERLAEGYRENYEDTDDGDDELSAQEWMERDVEENKELYLALADTPDNTEEAAR